MMMTTERPKFEVIVATATPVARRLLSIAQVRELVGLTESQISDTNLGAMIDGVLDDMAVYCRLATQGSKPPTFARESFRATWPAAITPFLYPLRASRSMGYWPFGPAVLVLPWRVPITEISITSGDVALVEGTDFQLQDTGAYVERLTGPWDFSGPLVVEWTAGFTPTPPDASYDESEGDPLPPGLVARIVDQIRYRYEQSLIPSILRSEDVPGIWSGSFNTPGGDAVDENGLIKPLRSALERYKAPPTFA